MRGTERTERTDRAAQPLLEPTGVTRSLQLEWRSAWWTAAAGCVGALGYGGLKAIWAMGAMVGVDHPEQLRPAGTSTAMWVAENMGTVALAALAALILLALVMPWGALVPRGILRTLGWLGTIMVIPGAVGLAETLDYIAGSHLFSGTRLGGISPVTFVFVYVCFLTLGLAFAATSFLTRHLGDPARVVPGRGQTGAPTSRTRWT